jgi:hypothetical protein
VENVFSTNEYEGHKAGDALAIRDITARIEHDHPVDYHPDESIDSEIRAKSDEKELFRFIQPSCDGAIVDNKYFLEVHWDYDAFCNCGGESIRVPVLIAPVADFIPSVCKFELP